MQGVKGTFRFQDKSKAFINSFKDCGIAFLHEAKDSLVAQTQRNTPVKSGDLKRSWGSDSYVDEGKLCAFIGSGLKYSIYVEKGTGIYAIEGDGRKTGWVYRDEKGLHYTRGQRPQFPLYRAYLVKRKKIANMAGKHFAKLDRG